MKKYYGYLFIGFLLAVIILSFCTMDKKPTAPEIKPADGAHISVVLENGKFDLCHRRRISFQTAPVISGLFFVFLTGPGAMCLPESVV